MLPKRIYLENFMGHIKSDIDCTKFSSCLIVGKNKNNPNISNGVGKSTIYKAIEYVLYGEYACDKIEEIIRDGADSCKVIFEFEIEKVDYQIIRQRGKSGTNIYLNKLVGEKWESFSAKTNTQTEAELLKLIKISYKAFKNSISFAQSDLDGISSASPDKRKELLKEPLNILIYNKYHKIAKKKLDDQNKELEKTNFVIENLGKPNEELDNIIAKIAEAEQNLIEKRNNYSKLNVEIGVERVKLAELEKLINSESTDIHAQLLETKNRIKEVEIELTRTNSEHSIALQKLQNNKLELSVKIAALDEKKSTLKTLKAEELKTPTTIQNEIDSFIEKEQRGRILIAKLEAEKLQYSKPIPAEEKCSNCFQIISKDHKDKCIKKSSEKLETILKDLETYKNGMIKCTAKRKSLEQEQKDISKKLSQISSYELDIANSNNNINKAQELITQYNETIEAKDADLTRLKSSIENLKTKELILFENAKKFNIDELNNKIVIIKNNIVKLENNIKLLLQQISSDDTLFGILKEKKSNIEENIVKLNKFLEDRKAIEYKISILTMTSNAFLKNIPTMIVSSILNDLQHESNQILELLRPNLTLQFVLNPDNDDLDIIFKVFDQARGYSSLSGGQKIMIALSLKLGLSKIIQRRLGVDIKFILLDEVDASLDKEGLVMLCDIIKKWSEHFKIFVITHNDFIIQKLNNHVITVSNDDGSGSTAQYSTTWEQ